MFRQEQNETTDTILEKLQASPLENIVVRIGENRFLISTSMIKLLAWNGIPDMIKDENSEDAKKHQTLRIGIKAMIRPFLPEILKKTWGKDVALAPRMNILAWLPSYFIHFFVNLIASKEWLVHVEICESCGENVYKIVGIAPNANNIVPTSSPSATPALPASDQSIPGRRQQNASRPADRDEPGGSMDASRCAQERQEHLRARTPEQATEHLSGDANLHSGQQQ